MQLKLLIDNIRDNVTHHKSIIKNFSFLSILNVFNLALPLITYPYLIRVLGIKTYGLVVFAQSIVSYFVVLVGFGFNTIAAKDVSVHRDNKDKLSEIISAVLIGKALLFVMSFLIIFICMHFISSFQNNQPLFYLSMWMCFYEMIFPIWYFQGTERMEFITYITITTRLLFLGLIFGFIRSPEDFLLLPLINGIGAITAGVISAYIVFYVHGIRFKIQSKQIIVKYYKESVPLFLSNVSSAIYVNTNKVLLGIFLGLSEVAIFDLAEKLTSMLKMPILLIGQSIFPRVASEKNKEFIKKIFRLALTIAICIIIVGMLTSEWMIEILGGSKMQGAVHIYQILLLSMIPITFSLFFANIALLSWGYNRDYFLIRLYSNGLYLVGIAVLYMLTYITLTTLAIFMVLIELLAAGLSVAFCKQRKINFIDKRTLLDWAKVFKYRFYWVTGKNS